MTLVERSTREVAQNKLLQRVISRASRIRSQRRSISQATEGAFREQQDRATPLGRIAQPEDIALAVTFLAGDDSRWITGQVIVAAGGKRM